MLPYLCADTSGSGTAQSCTTTPGFTPQLGNCFSYTTTTDSGSSLTLNVNASGAYAVQIPSPSGWVGVYAAGQIIHGTPYTACYYVNGDDTPEWNVQQQGTIGSPAQGGTGIDTSASTGIAQVASGSWSVSTALANGTTGTTQTVGDSTTKLATDAFVSANAAPPVGNVTNETTSWSLVANNIYRFTGSGASNATTPATTGATGLISFVNAGSANVTVVTGTPTLVCLPSSCIVPPTASAFINTDGVDQYAIISNATVAQAVTITPAIGLDPAHGGTATCWDAAHGGSAVCNSTSGIVVVTWGITPTDGDLFTINWSTAKGSFPVANFGIPPFSSTLGGSFIWSPYWPGRMAIHHQRRKLPPIPSRELTVLLGVLSR